MVPIFTINSGLCYKIKYGFPFINLFEPKSYVKFEINFKIPDVELNNLTKINLLIAAENTWQGIIDENWPYDSVPLKISENFRGGIANVKSVKLVENVWIYLTGEGNIEKCMKKWDLKDSKCISMFHPYSYNYTKR